MKTPTQPFLMLFICGLLACNIAIQLLNRQDTKKDLDRVERAVNRSYKRQQEVDSLLLVAGAAKQEINNIENKKTENYNTYVQQYHEAISADSSDTYRLYLRNTREIDSAFRSGFFTPSNP